MKKKIFMLMAMMLTSFTLTLSAENVKLTGKVSSNGDNHNGHSRAPLAPVFICQEGHELTFPAELLDYTLEIIDEDENIVFTAIVGEEGIVILPDSLVGTFVLELERGSIIFEGEIEL